MDKFILIFNSVHRVMKAENLLKKANLDSKTIPVPRKLSSDCGLAIKIYNTSLDKVMLVLKEEPAEEIYIEKNDNFEKVI